MGRGGNPRQRDALFGRACDMSPAAGKFNILCCDLEHFTSYPPQFVGDTICAFGDGANFNRRETVGIIT